MGLSPILPFRNYSSILKVKERARDGIFVENNNSESEDDVSFDDYTSSSDYSEENEYENNTIAYMLFTPTLEDLKNILYVALNPYFDEFEIAVVSCPCLTSEPFNLAAAGLSGNTGILEFGHFNNLYPRPQTNFAFNIQDMLERFNYDVFVIGSGFAAEPLMPYNGHLTMNAVVSANLTNVINNSCIAYKDVSTGQRKLEIINDDDYLYCCIFGQFFFSEGKRGPVIKMRAKGRRSRSNIIALIQSILTIRCQVHPLIGLGIVLVLNGGQTDQRLLPNNFVDYDYNEVFDYYSKLSPYMLNCINLIALGALIDPFVAYKTNHKKLYLIHSANMFNTFSNDESCGNFFNDITPKETEYIVYINIAQEKYFIP